MHAYEIVNARGAWTRLKPELRVRIGVYQKALKIIADHDVQIICRGVDVPALDARHPGGHDHPHSVVLNFLIEEVDRRATAAAEYALVIADEISTQETHRRELWDYQKTATWGYMGQKITRVLDTIHFAPSHASRLLQAADLVAYLYRRRETIKETDPRAEAAWAAMQATIYPNVCSAKCWHPQPRRS